MAKGFTIKGVNELNKKLKENATLSDVKQVVKMNGAELTKETSINAPVDTATLERSVTQTLKDGGLTSVTEPHTDYEGYVEFGTRYTNAKPYLRPAFKKQSDEFIEDMKRLVD